MFFGFFFFFQVGSRVEGVYPGGRDRGRDPARVVRLPGELTPGKSFICAEGARCVGASELLCMQPFGSVFTQSVRGHKAVRMSDALRVRHGRVCTHAFPNVPACQLNANDTIRKSRSGR